MRTFLWSTCILFLITLSLIYTETHNNWESTPKHSDFLEHQLPASIDIQLNRPNKDLNDLTLETKLLAEEFLILARDEGYHLFITEGMRTLERQQALYDQGRTLSGTIVTWTMNSRHLRGIAFDIAFDPKHHETAYPADQELREAVGALGESLGLVRGGRWRQPDMPHFQYGW